MKLRVIDLFAGAGGFGVGLQQAGLDVVIANEIEAPFAKTYQMNHPATKVVQAPVQEIEKSTLDQFSIDVVVGGPPCQGFSTVGAKKQDDPRNNLFLEFLRIVETVSPKFVLFENVAGFMKLYKGFAYDSLIDRLSRLGYETNAAMVDAVDYGLPQFRKRTIIFGWKKGGRPIAFPQVTHGDDGTLLPFVDLWSAISDLPELMPGGAVHEYERQPLNAYQQLMRQYVNGLTDHNCANYGSKMRKILSLLPAGGTVMDLPEHLRPASYFKNTYARLLPDRPAPTITRNFGTPSSSRCVHPWQNRALSTREGARLQSFPDDYVFAGGKGMKNLQIGNAVPPLLARKLGDALVRAANG